MRAGTGGFRGSMDDALRDLTVTEDDYLADDEPVVEHYRRQAERIRAQLRDETTADPTLLERLRRDLATWEAAIARETVDEHWSSGETVDEHWSSGEGDRKLF